MPDNNIETRVIEEWVKSLSNIHLGILVNPPQGYSLSSSLKATLNEEKERREAEQILQDPIPPAPISEEQKKVLNLFDQAGLAALAPDFSSGNAGNTRQAVYRLIERVEETVQSWNALKNNANKSNAMLEDMALKLKTAQKTIQTWQSILASHIQLATLPKQTFQQYYEEMQKLFDNAAQIGSQQSGSSQSKDHQYQRSHTLENTMWEGFEGAARPLRNSQSDVNEVLKQVDTAINEFSASYPHIWRSAPPLTETSPFEIGNTPSLPLGLSSIPGVNFLITATTSVIERIGSILSAMGDFSNELNAMDDLAEAVESPMVERPINDAMLPPNYRKGVPVFFSEEQDILRLHGQAPEGSVRGGSASRALVDVTIEVTHCMERYNLTKEQIEEAMRAKQPITLERREQVRDGHSDANTNVAKAGRSGHGRKK